MNPRTGKAQARHKPPRPRPDLTWLELANCRDADPRMFHDPDRYTDALAVCRGCPVTIVCRRHGQRQPGVWGGRINDARRKTEP